MDRQDEALKLLKDIKHINHLINEIQENIDIIATKLTSTTITIKDVQVQTSMPNDPMAEQVVQLIQMQKELEEHQLSLITKKRNALDIVKKMTLKNQQYIILKYFSGKTIEEIGGVVGYAYRQTWENIHTAEKEFIETYEKEFEKFA